MTGLKIAALLIGAADMASCTTTTPEATSADLRPLAGLITGTEASMVRLEAAARSCGAETVSIDRGDAPRWIGIGRGLEAPISDPRVRCTMQWITDHPEEDLYFVGNAPFDE